MSESLQRGLIIVLAAITAVIHLWLGIGGALKGDLGLVMFILNGLGFIGLLAAMFVPGIPIFNTRRKLAAYLMIGFAALTFILFFVVNGFSYWNPAAVISKLAELFLIVVTFLHLRRL